MIEQVFIDLLFAHNITLPHDFKDRVEIEEKFQELFQRADIPAVKNLQEKIESLEEVLATAKNELEYLSDQLAEYTED
jgi:hypothetical protein